MHWISTVIVLTVLINGLDSIKKSVICRALKLQNTFLNKLTGTAVLLTETILVILLSNN